MGKRKFVTATRPKQMYAAIPLEFQFPRFSKFTKTLLWLAADAVSPVRQRGFLLFLGLWFQLLLVPLVMRLLLLLLLLLLPLLLLLLLLRLLLVRCLGEGTLLLEWESCLQNQLGRLVTMEKTSAL